MRTTSYFLSSFARRSLGVGVAILLLTACGTMQESVQVRDDVYDIPDRTVVASVDPVPETPVNDNGDDYYNTEEAAKYQQGSYYDRTYNDPSWYNRDRFGFGYGVSPYGSSWSMSYGSGGGYNPNWNNSWQSGYGSWGDPYGYYDPWNGGIYDPWGYNNGWGNGYGGGYGCGYNSGWNNGFGYGGYGYPYGCGGYAGYGGYGGGGYWPGSDFGTTHIVAHRPSMSGGGNPGGATVGGIPRSSRTRNDIGLLRPPVPQKQRTERPDFSRTKPQDNGQNGTWQQPERKERKERKERVARPDRSRERGEGSPRIDQSGGGGSRGGGSGGGTSPSPRPRR